MTRKDYILIALALRDVQPRDDSPFCAVMQWKNDRDSIADAFAADNPHFDRVRFDAASGE